MNLLTELDSVASDIEKENAQIALAIDQVSDRLALFMPSGQIKILQAISILKDAQDVSKTKDELIDLIQGGIEKANAAQVTKLTQALRNRIEGLSGLLGNITNTLDAIDKAAQENRE